MESIYNYLEWLEKAFVIYRCPRYDLKGKSVLKTQEKYVVTMDELAGGNMHGVKIVHLMELLLQEKI